MAPASLPAVLAAECVCGSGPTNAQPVVLTGVQAATESAVFSPDGNRFAAGGANGEVVIWPLWTAAADLLCTRVWRNLTLEEWNPYIGEGIPYEATCPNLPKPAGAH